MLLYERYRPTSFSEVIGQAKIIRALETIRRTEGFIGQCLWFIGRSGSGKTTLARIVSREVTQSDDVEEIDAQDVNLDLIRGWESDAQHCRMFGARVFIINECHRLSAKIISRLLTFAENRNVQKNFTLIGTTTIEGSALFDESFDAAPFGSRTKELRLTSQGTAKPAASRLKEIAEQEGLDGQPEEKYLRLFNDAKGNWREALQKIAAGAMLKD